MPARSPSDPYDDDAIARMIADPAVIDASGALLNKSFEYGYYRNFKWLGRPIIQYPQDIVALQEVIWNYKPTLVVETGVAHGGSLTFYASILELIGGVGEVVGVEIEFREHNRKATFAHPLAKRVSVIDGSSIDPDVIRRVQSIAEHHQRVMVILDSLHTHEHVLEELRQYSRFVRIGGPLIVFGTSVGRLNPDLDLNRSWNVEQNPASALREFMLENHKFEIDHEVNDKLLLTDAPDGYLRRVR
jgi:cephalosporin hydroxylase